MPQRRGAHGDFPALVGGVQIVADANDSRPRIHGILDEDVLVAGIAVGSAQLFHDDEIPGPRGNLLLGFHDRDAIGSQAAGTLAKMLEVKWALIIPAQIFLDVAVAGVDALEVLVGCRDPTQDQNA